MNQLSDPEENSSYHAILLEGEIAVWNAEQQKIHQLCQLENGKWSVRHRGKLDNEEITRVADHRVSIADQVFVRYIRQVHLAEALADMDKRQWLLILLETAWEVDFLSGILLGCVDQGRHQVELAELGRHREEWFKTKASWRTSRGVLSGEVWICNWATAGGNGYWKPHELWIFVQRVELPVIPEIASWYMQQNTPEGPKLLLPLEDSHNINPPQPQGKWLPVTKESAVKTLSWWFRYGHLCSNSTTGSRQVTVFNDFFVQHRLGNFAALLRLARVDGGNAVVRTETESRLENEVRTLRARLTNQGGMDSGLHPNLNGASVQDTENERALIVQKLKDLYFDHFREGNAKDFGRCVTSMVTGLLDIVESRYDEALSAMARVFGEKKGPGEDAKVAFDYYCRRNWKHLLADHPSESSTDQNMDGADPAYDPLDCDTGGGIVTLEDVDFQSCSSKSGTGLSLATLRKSVMLEFEHHLSSRSKVALGVFETCFDDLWRVTVIMFLQDPQFRFWGDYPVLGNFDRKEHQPIDAGLMAGQKIITIVPPVLKLPKGMQPKSGHGSMNQRGIVHAKALVDFVN
ncbi:hypothetical protein BSKO_07649 [Bryopsis sp. KO-2023]|nr:hypothetical protein BSKO_07649 [Bryopsis sp. KO-2023]